MSTDEVLRILEHWKEEPPIGMVVRAACGVKQRRKPQAEVPKEMTQEQFDRLADSMRANAQAYGLRRN